MSRRLSGVVGALVAAARLTAYPSATAIGDGVVAPLAGTPVDCTDGRRVSLRVALAIPSRRAVPLKEIIRDEVAAIWQRHGVALDWIDVASVRPLDNGVLRLIVQDDELMSNAHLPRYSLGWIQFVGGRPQSIIRVSRRTALMYFTREVLLRDSPVPLEGLLDTRKYADVFTRLLTWSLAHEIGHYVLSMRHHTRDGLMRRAFIPQDLLAGRTSAVALMPAEAARLRALATACRSADLRR